MNNAFFFFVFLFYVCQADAQRADDRRVKAIQDNVRHILLSEDYHQAPVVEFNGCAEGGEAKVFSSQQYVERVVATCYGETGKSTAEYFFQRGKISFVSEKETLYNRPIYYDSAMAASNNELEFFDEARSTVTETRSYFHNGKLFRQEIVENGKEIVVGFIPPAEQKRILADLEKILRMKKKRPG